MHRPWLFNAPPAALRCPLLFAALLRRLLFCAAPLRCLVFCAGCPAGCFPMEFCSNAPASNSSVTAPRPATTLSGCPLPAASCSVASPGQQQLSHHGAPASLSAVAPLPAAALSRRPQPAASSRWLFAAAPLPATNLIRRRKVLRFG